MEPRFSIIKVARPAGPRSAVIAVLLLAACAADPARVTGPAGPINRGMTDQSRPLVAEAAIPVTTENTSRPHVVLEDMTVTARQITIFGHVPTNADVDNELRKRAAELRADAIINVRYGQQGVGAVSWSQISATGQAIRYTDGQP